LNIFRAAFHGYAFTLLLRDRSCPTPVVFSVSVV
jgi:hypothetical protein